MPLYAMREEQAFGGGGVPKESGRTQTLRERSKDLEMTETTLLQMFPDRNTGQVIRRLLIYSESNI